MGQGFPRSLDGLGISHEISVKMSGGFGGLTGLLLRFGFIHMTNPLLAVGRNLWLLACFSWGQLNVLTTCLKAFS